jgi:hypothetical protein
MKSRGGKHAVREDGARTKKAKAWGENGSVSDMEDNAEYNPITVWGVSL